MQLLQTILNLLWNLTCTYKVKYSSSSLSPLMFSVSSLQRHGDCRSCLFSQIRSLIQLTFRAFPVVEVLPWCLRSQFHLQVTDVLASIATIGEAVGLYAEACLLIGSLRSRLRQVAAAVASQSRPRMLLLQGFDPLLLGGHWVCEMETLAGGFDGLQKPGCYPEQLHWQRVIAYAPEVIVLAPRSSGLDQTLAEVAVSS